MDTNKSSGIRGGRSFVFQKQGGAMPDLQREIIQC
jgi:hypothetical protein